VVRALWTCCLLQTEPLANPHERPLSFGLRDCSCRAFPVGVPAKRNLSKGPWATVLLPESFGTHCHVWRCPFGSCVMGQASPAANPYPLWPPRLSHRFLACQYHPPRGFKMPGEPVGRSIILAVALRWHVLRDYGLKPLRPGKRVSGPSSASISSRRVVSSSRPPSRMCPELRPTA